MGKLIIRNSGVETQLVNGLDFNTLSGESGVYVIGVSTDTNSFEQLNPDGSIINYAQSGSGCGAGITGGTFDANTGELILVDFTGGTVTITGITSEFNGGVVSGATTFLSDITGTTINADEFIGDGSLLEGVVGLTYSDLGFTITNPTPPTIDQNVALPYNSTLEYNGPLIIEPGYFVVIPAGTTLTVLP